MQPIATGFIIGIGPNDGFLFNTSKPYVLCKICGRIYQNDETDKRQLWSSKHARSHSSKEHHMLKISGRWATPEAAAILAPFGIFSIRDMVTDPEVIHALGTASRAPSDDVEY